MSGSYDSDLPDDVLQGYVDDLLGGAQEQPPTPPAPRAPLQRAVGSVATAQPRFAEPTAAPRAEAQRIAREKLSRLLNSAPPPVETARPAPTRVQDEVQPLQASQTAAVQTDGDPCAWLANGRPAWAQERFDVLLFDVSGLTLAVPLIALGQIQPLTDKLTPLFGQAEWFMGLQPTPMGSIRTVNTALFVMPERYDPQFPQAARYVVSISGVAWGLAVTAVNQPIALEPEGVRWRSDRSKRPWLAGTVKQHMCALLDIPTMGRILQESDANRV